MLILKCFLHVKETPLRNAINPATINEAREKAVPISPFLYPKKTHKSMIPIIIKSITKFILYPIPLLL